MFHARAGDADRVAFLEGIATNDRGRHLAGDDYQRNGVHVSRGNTGDGIRGARAGGHQHHAGFAGRPGVTISGVSRALLMTNQNMSDVVLPE